MVEDTCPLVINGVDQECDLGVQGNVISAWPLVFVWYGPTIWAVPFAE
jgi:hypothetical protein